MVNLTYDRTIIRVNRSARPLFPDQIIRIMHPELQTSGSRRYYLGDVQCLLDQGQIGGNVLPGWAIYRHLIKVEYLPMCLGLNDGVEIQREGVPCFKRFFGVKALFLWKSVGVNCYDHLFVPCLDVKGDRLLIRWYFVENDFGVSYPAACIGAQATEDSGFLPCA